MNPRLEEIRKRLLTPTSPSATTPRYKTRGNSGHLYSETLARLPEQPTVDYKAAEGAGETGIRSDAVAENKEFGVAQSEERTPHMRDGLAQAVSQLFEPARQCHRQLLEITRTSKAISELTRLALELRDPLNSFHDHIRKLSSSFESMRLFRDELGVLAESFAPVRPLHQQMIEMAYNVRAHLSRMADGLEPAKALKVDIAELATAIESLSDLQDRFYELSEAFGDAQERREDGHKDSAVPHAPANEAE